MTKEEGKNKSQIDVHQLIVQAPKKKSIQNAVQYIKSKSVPKLPETLEEINISEHFSRSILGN